MSDQEKRRFPRFDASDSYSGEATTGVFKAISSNQGPGGAFLETSMPIEMGAVLVLTIHDPIAKEEPVFVLAKVVRARTEPSMAVGVQWRKAVCPTGVTRLRQFLEVHFRLLIDPVKISMIPSDMMDGIILYDFELGTVRALTPKQLEDLERTPAFKGLKIPPSLFPQAQFTEVRLASRSGQAQAPQIQPMRDSDKPELTDKPRRTGFAVETAADERAVGLSDTPVAAAAASHPSSPEVSKENEGIPDELRRWKEVMRRRKRSSVPVTLACGDSLVSGVLRNIDREGLLVTTPDLIPSVGEHVVVEIPVTVGLKSGGIVVVGKVARVARDGTTRHLAVDLAVVSVNEGSNDGLFELFLEALQPAP